MNKKEIKEKIRVSFSYRIISYIKNYIFYYFSLIDIRRTNQSIKNRFNDNNKAITVLFLVQYIPGWNKLEPIYSKMKSNANFRPIIICVPSNINNSRLIPENGQINDTYEYFISHEYNAENALVGNNKWLDLKLLNPDFVFHSRPYNCFMPKCYSSSKIRKYALICNVLYGTNTTINGQNVTINRDYFKDVFIYFAFDDSEKQIYISKFGLGYRLGIQHCLPYGGIGLEEILSQRESVKRERQVVLWTPRWSTDVNVGGSNFFRYKDTIIRLVKENPEIDFILRPHPLMFDNFMSTGEMSEKEVNEFKLLCKLTPNLKLDEEKEYTKTFWNSDILIADPSGILPEYFVTEKPIIYCHSKIQFDYTKYAKRIIESSYPVINDEELIKCFVMLTSGKDIKKQEREKTIKELFSDIENSSQNITSALASFIFES